MKGLDPLVVLLHEEMPDYLQAWGSRLSVMSRISLHVHAYARIAQRRGLVFFRSFLGMLCSLERLIFCRVAITIINESGHITHRRLKVGQFSCISLTGRLAHCGHTLLKAPRCYYYLPNFLANHVKGRSSIFCTYPRSVLLLFCIPSRLLTVLSVFVYPRAIMTC